MVRHHDLAAAICVVLLLGHYLWTHPFVERSHYNDFGTFYRAACSGSLYAPDPLSPRVDGVVFVNLNPPQLHLALRPLCLVTLPVAHAIWMALSVVVIGGGTLWIRRHDAVRIGPSVALTLAACTSALFLTGQITAVLFPLLVAAWLADKRRYMAVAGAALGVLISLKPFLAVPVLWWVARREWRALMAAGLALAVSLILGATAYGWDALLAWLTNLRTVSWPWVALNASVWAPWARIFGEAPYYVPVVDSATMRLACTALGGAIVAVGTTWALGRTRSRDCGWALCVVAALLLSPLGWTYYGWLAIPPLLAVPVPRWAWLTAGIGWAMPPLVLVLVSMESAVMTMSVGSSYTWGLLALWAGVVRTAASATPPCVGPAQTDG